MKSPGSLLEESTARLCYDEDKHTSEGEGFGGTFLIFAAPDVEG